MGKEVVTNNSKERLRLLSKPPRIASRHVIVPMVESSSSARLRTAAQVPLKESGEESGSSAVAIGTGGG